MNRGSWSGQEAVLNYSPPVDRLIEGGVIAVITAPRRLQTFPYLVTAVGVLVSVYGFFEFRDHCCCKKLDVSNA